MNKPSTADILAAARAAKKLPIPQVEVFGTCGTEGGWSVHAQNLRTRYHQEHSSSDSQEVQRVLCEFWRKLAIELSAVADVFPWNAVLVEADLDYGSISGTAFLLNNFDFREINTKVRGCPVSVNVSISHWEDLLDQVPEGPNWDAEVTRLYGATYADIEAALRQEPAASAMSALRKQREFRLWIQPHEGPELGRWIPVPS